MLQKSPWAKEYKLLGIPKTFEPYPEEPVYSIRVDSDCHSFVANGFVNHNTE